MGPLRNKGPADIDMVCVRENSEGEYAGVGGRVHLGFEHELALQTDVFTRKGVDQVAATHSSSHVPAGGGSRASPSRTQAPTRSSFGTRSLPKSRPAIPT